MLSNQTENIIEAVTQLRYFLSTAHLNWAANQQLKSFQMPNGETISCVFWNNTFFISGTDIVRSLVFRFQAYGRPVKNMKKFEEGIFSDLRNLKPGVDAILEEPRSEFLEMLYKNNCIRTQKKQKVFYWFSVPHDRLFMDALERDHKRESEGKEPSTVALQNPPLVEAMTMNPQTKIPATLKHYSQTMSTPTTVMNQNNSYYIHANRPQVQPIKTSINYSQNKSINMNYPMVQTPQQSPMIQNQVINNNNQVVQIVNQTIDSGNQMSPSNVYSPNPQQQQQQPMYFTTTQSQTMYTNATTGNQQQSQQMYSPTSAHSQQPMYSPNSTNNQQPMYSPNSTNNQQPMYSPTSANSQQPMYSQNSNNWVNQQQTMFSPISATNANTSPVYSNSSYVISSSPQQMMPTPPQQGQMMTSTSMNNNVQPQYINNSIPTQMMNNSQISVQSQQQQINSGAPANSHSQNNGYTINSQDGLDQSEMKNNGNQNFGGAAVNSTTAPNLIQTTIMYAPTSVATIYSPSSSTSSVIVDGTNPTVPTTCSNTNEQIVFDNGSNDSRDEGNYTCDIKGCGRKFKRMEFLRRHQRCHANDSSYGKEMLNHRKSTNELNMVSSQNQTTMVKTPTYQSIPNNNNIITHMPSPPSTTDITYSNMIINNDCNQHIYTPVSPNYNNVTQDSNGTYYNQSFNNINGYNNGTNNNSNITSPPMQFVNSTTTPTNSPNGGNIYTTQSSTDSQKTSNYQNMGMYQNIGEKSNCNGSIENNGSGNNTTLCQIPSPPLQYQSTYNTTAANTNPTPIYSTTNQSTTPIY